jgi:hypothetical protein
MHHPLGAKRSVMIAQLGDEQGVPFDLVNYTVFIIDAS